MEDDVETPVETVFDAPVVAHGAGEGLGVELRGGEGVAAFHDHATGPMKNPFRQKPVLT